MLLRQRLGDITTRKAKLISDDSKSYSQHIVKKWRMHFANQEVDFEFSEYNFKFSIRDISEVHICLQRGIIYQSIERCEGGFACIDRVTCIVCCEDEHKKIVEFCKQSVKEEKVWSLYVCGLLRTGQSLSMDKIKGSLIDWMQEELPYSSVYYADE